MSQPLSSPLARWPTASSHGHDHGAHGGDDQRSTRALRMALVLTVVILVAEGDRRMALELAGPARRRRPRPHRRRRARPLAVRRLARAPAGLRGKTYGYLRWEILAALINGATLLGISVWIVVEAFGRFHASRAVVGRLMLVVVGGRPDRERVNAVGRDAPPSRARRQPQRARRVPARPRRSPGVRRHVVAAAVIRFTGWLRADPIASLLRRSHRVAAPGAWCASRGRAARSTPPTSRSTRSARARVDSGVESVHDLHVGR